MSEPDLFGIAAGKIAEPTIDIDLMANTVREILSDMNLGACAETITQTVQVFDLPNGKRAALRITITTDPTSYM